VKTHIGIKVFGPDLTIIERVSKEIEAVMKPINGARDVLAPAINGKGYLEIDIDREKIGPVTASAVEDIQNEIEVALGAGSLPTRREERSAPVRIRYARDSREDEGRCQSAC